MASRLEEGENMMKRPLLATTSNKGGLKTLPFILVNGALERMASCGIMPNMILYLMGVYGLEMDSASNFLFLYSAASGFVPVVGALIADSYVGRYWMTSFGIVTNLLGMILLWLTTMLPQVRPPCDQLSGTCESPSAPHLIFLICCFAFICIGTGGISASSLAFGADQLNSQCHYESYITWYYVSTAASVVLVMTCITYIQENLGWKLGLGVPMFLAFAAAVCFLMASSMYVKSKPTPGLLSGLCQVAVASYRKRHVQFSGDQASNFSYYCNYNSAHLVPTDNLRFLNKACVIRNPDQELTLDGIASDPWSLCTVDQVEDPKSMVRIVPLWSTVIIVHVNIGSFGTLQSKSMNRHVTSSSFEIPAGSFTMFMILSLILWLGIYDRIILPLASRILNRPARLDGRQKMGVAVAVSCLSMAVSAVVERLRRDAAIREGNVDDPHSIVSMSALWLVPQNCLRGVVEGFLAVGQIEFYVSEFPRSMGSVASNIGGVSFAVASIMSSGLMTAIDTATRSGGKESWVSSNINKGHYDYYYCVLAFLNLINFLYFLVCNRAYGPHANTADNINV